jgi:hypothetical protein
VDGTQNGDDDDPKARVVENGVITRNGKAYLRSKNEYSDSTASSTNDRCAYRADLLPGETISSRATGRRSERCESP